MKHLFLILISLILLLLSCSKPENTKTIITIQPLNSFPKNLQDTVKQAIEKFYGFDVIKNKDINIPSEFYTTIKSPRYRADSIIHYLRTTKPDSVNYIIGLTTTDISTTKKDKKGNMKKPISKYRDWGIFGLGFRPGTSCVVSTFRLKHKENTISISRLKKVAMHELGHNLGLSHCPNKNCFMQDAAETIKTIDNVEINLCQDCKNEIQ